MSLILDLVGTSLVVVLLYWLSKSMRSHLKPKESKMKGDLYMSGDAAEPISRRMYLDLYAFIAYFVLFNAIVFVITTVFFIAHDITPVVLIYVAIIGITLIFGVKKSFDRETLKPIKYLGGSE